MDLIETIKWLYSQTRLVIGNKTIILRKGVIQGGILSPKLFNIFYDTLIEKLNNLQIFMIAYADDITLAFTSTNLIKIALKKINE